MSTAITGANADPTYLYVDPTPEIISAPGENKTITIKVFNVTNLYGWDLQLTYNDTLLEKVDITVVGPNQVAPAQVGNYTLTDVSTPGKIIFGCGFSGVQGALPFNGSGVLVWITFEGKMVGLSNLTFVEEMTFLWDPDGVSIPTTITLWAHDVAITDITGPATVIPGDIANISVNVANLGDALENFNVTVFYDSEPIGIKPISLGAGLSTTEIFEWNTTNVNPMVYNVTAVASTVEGEINTDNNTEIMEGGINVIPEFPTLAPLLLALAILAVSTIVLKRKPLTKPSTSGSPTTQP
ncbi:MAG: hypothetical protein GWO26_10405 [Phycisphaerae bacterium]|nr:hypothetical protein [Phycisphaerae bacterium]